MKKMLGSLLVLTASLLILQVVFGHLVKKHLTNLQGPLNQWTERSGLSTPFKVSAKGWHSSWFLMTRNPLITLRDPGNSQAELALRDVSLDIDLWPSIFKASIEVEIKGFLQDSKQLTHIQANLSLWDLIGGELRLHRLTLHLPSLALPTLLYLWAGHDQLAKLVSLFDGGSIDLEGSLTDVLDQKKQKGKLHLKAQNLQLGTPSPTLPRVYFLPAEGDLDVTAGGWNFRQPVTLEDSKKTFRFGLHKSQTQEPFKMTLDGPPIFLQVMAHRLGCRASSRLEWIWKDNGLNC